MLNAIHGMKLHHEGALHNVGKTGQTQPSYSYAVLQCAAHWTHVSDSSRRVTCGIVGHWLYVLIASLRFGLYTSSNTFTCKMLNTVKQLVGLQACLAALRGVEDSA